MKVLNAGAGWTPLLDLTYAADEFQGWEEIRLDCNPDTKPHMLSDIRDINAQDAQFDAVYSCHTLEHIYPSHVHYALDEFYRVLKDGGFIVMYLPDAKKIAQKILEDKQEEVQYERDGNKIRAVDMIFGLEGSDTNNPAMMHHTVFTDNSIKEKLTEAGFKNVSITYDMWDMWVKAWK